MTTAEYQAGVERLASARAALQVYEELALELATFLGAGKDRGLLICVKEQISATRLLVLEVGERCKPLGPDPGRQRNDGTDERQGFAPVKKQRMWSEDL